MSIDWKERYNQWNNYSELSDYLLKELNEMTEEDRIEAFHMNLEFGTGGMRGILGAGSNRMNIHTIRRATEGFATYLIEKHGENAKIKGVAIAYDNRHFSKEFAKQSALVLANHGIKSYVFSELRPTPELSFAVRHLGCVAGIVVTASHNPREYNGYKVYDEHGCQYTPEMVDEYVSHIDAIPNPMEIKIASNEDLIEYIDKDIDEEYIKRLKEVPLDNDKYNKDFKIVYTPLHGTGAKIVPVVLKDLGYNVSCVEKQMTADPDFSGVKSSNPEDAKAFDEAIEQAKEIGAEIVFATDPDADRLGAAILHNGEYVLINGNQMASLLTSYIMHTLNKKGEIPSNGMMYSTVVSSPLPGKIAKSYGVDTEYYLTGFKFIGDAVQRNIDTKQFLFGFEESYGCLIKDFVRDKDSVQAIIMMSELCAHARDNGKTLIDVLNVIYDKYGYFLEKQHSITLTGISGQQKIKEIIENYRNNPPTQIAGLKVTGYEDYQLQVKVDNGKETTINLPKSNFIKYYLEDGSWFILRPSGTEPKLKVYLGVSESSLDLSEKKINSIKNFILDVIGV